MYNFEDRNFDIRFSSVSKIIIMWKRYNDFIEDLSAINRAEDYKNV